MTRAHVTSSCVCEKTMPQIFCQYNSTYRLGLQVFVHFRQPCQQQFFNFQFWIILLELTHLLLCRGQQRKTREKTHVPTTSILTSTYTLWWQEQPTARNVTSGCMIQLSYGSFVTMTPCLLTNFDVDGQLCTWEDHEFFLSIQEYLQAWMLSGVSSICHAQNFCRWEDHSTSSDALNNVAAYFLWRLEE
jgi:hypothetical protein